MGSLPLGRRQSDLWYCSFHDNQYTAVNIAHPTPPLAQWGREGIDHASCTIRKDVRPDFDYFIDRFTELTGIAPEAFDYVPF